MSILKTNGYCMLLLLLSPLQFLLWIGASCCCWFLPIRLNSNLNSTRNSTLYNNWWVRLVQLIVVSGIVVVVLATTNHPQPPHAVSLVHVVVAAANVNVVVVKRRRSPHHCRCGWLYGSRFLGSPSGSGDGGPAPPTYQRRRRRRTIFRLRPSACTKSASAAGFHWNNNNINNLSCKHQRQSSSAPQQLPFRTLFDDGDGRSTAKHGKNAMQIPTSLSDTPSLVGSSSSSNPIPSSDNSDYHIVVVGGGVGGLALASRIMATTTADMTTNSRHSNNVHVTILEKNEFVGGRCHSIYVHVPTNTTTATISHNVSAAVVSADPAPPRTLDDNDDTKYHSFRHESGPSLLLLPRIYQDLFSILPNRSACDYNLTWQQCIPAYTIVFEQNDDNNDNQKSQPALLQMGFPSSSYSNVSDPYYAQNMQSQDILNTYETNGATKWNNYIETCYAFLQCGLSNFIEQTWDITTLPAFLVASLRNNAQSWPLKPHSDVTSAFFSSSSHLQALASFQDLYVGLDPYRNSNGLGGGILDTTAPAVFGLLSAMELYPTSSSSPDCGIYAPIGGFASVQQAMQQLATECGVQTYTNTTVTRITNTGVYYNNNTATSKTTCSFLPADLILVNADLPYAISSLCNDEADDDSSDARNHVEERSFPVSQSRPQQEQQFQVDATTPTTTTAAATAPRFDWDDERYRFSSGVVAFHWCLNATVSDLTTHSVFLSASTTERARQSWKCVRDDDSGERGNHKNNGQSPWIPFSTDNEPFNFYVHRASHTDPTAPPPGMDSLTVLVPCQRLRRRKELAFLSRDEAIMEYKKQFDTEFIDRVRTAVLRRLGQVESLRDLPILHEIVETPATYADKYNVGAGTPFGLSHGLGQLSLTRPGPQAVPSLPNVLFCGASSRPGNGVPLVLIGAKHVAQLALSRIRRAITSRQ